MYDAFLWFPVSVGYTMIPSLAHLSVLAIPHGVSLIATQEVVLKYILSDSRRQLSNAMFKGRKLNSEFCIRRIKYEDSLKCGTGNDSDIMNICEELRVLFECYFLLPGVLRLRKSIICCLVVLLCGLRFPPNSMLTPILPLNVSCIR